MSTNLLLFAQWYTDKVRYGGIRKIGKFKYYDKDNVLVCSLIPCYNTNSNENGMYDVVRRRFFVNVGEGAFISGKNQGSIVDGINNLVAYAKTNPQEGSETYGGDKIGYKDGMRWSSSGASEGTYGSGRLTGWIPYEHGATLRIKNMGMTVSSYV